MSGNKKPAPTSLGKRPHHYRRRARLRRNFPRIAVVCAFLPGHHGQGDGDPDHPRLQQELASPAEQRARWEVRAAQWRAHELAHVVFGAVSDMGMISMYHRGDMRGLLRLEVPFDGAYDADLVEISQNTSPANSRYLGELELIAVCDRIVR